LSLKLWKFHEKHKHVISSRLYRYDAVFGKQSKLDLKLVLEVVDVVLVLVVVVVPLSVSLSL